MRLFRIKNFYKGLIDIIFIALVSVILFWGASELPLEKWDEFTNAQVIEDTKESNSFPVLFLNEKPFFEKPPLWYYLNLGLTEILPYSPLTIRLISIFSGIILFVLILRFTRREFGYLVSLLIFPFFVTIWHFFIFNLSGIFASHNLKSADSDALQLLLSFSTIYILFIYKRTLSIKYLFLAAVFTGLGIMTKGVFSLFPIFVFFLWFFYKKNYSEIWKISLYFLPVLIIVILPWHIFMYLNFGNDFIESYFAYHIFSRVITPLESHEGGVLFHIINFLNPAIFLTGILFPFALYSIWKKKLFKEFKFFYLSVYSLLILLIVSIIQTKLSWYLLPVYPTAMIISAWYLSKVKFEFIRKYIRKINL